MWNEDFGRRSGFHSLLLGGICKSISGMEDGHVVDILDVALLEVR